MASEVTMENSLKYVEVLMGSPCVRAILNDVQREVMFP
jgi:hypothetical protein